MITLSAEITINDSTTITINKRNLISLSSNCFVREQSAIASYGIISNNGKVEFKDTDGKVLEYANNGLLVENLECKIWLTDTVTKAQSLVGTLKTSNWDYDTYEAIASVSIKDDLEEWQDITVQGFNNPNLYGIFSVTAQNYYDYLYQATPLKYNMLPFTSLDTSTQEIIKNTIIPYWTLDASNLWNEWNKLCQICGLHIFKNDENKTVCIYLQGS